MTISLTLNTNKAISSVEILDDSQAMMVGSRIATDSIKQDLLLQQQNLSELTETLTKLIAQINLFCRQFFSQHSESIAELSVQIAEKILMQQISTDNYKIEPIIRKALESTTDIKDLTLELNPDDIEQFKQSNCSDFSHINVIANPQVGKAQCKIDSPSGIIESIISEQLKHVAVALKKSQDA